MPGSGPVSTGEPASKRGAMGTVTAAVARVRCERSDLINSVQDSVLYAGWEGPLCKHSWDPM
jgi:hypothetical protein